jgi:hypothetical protein
LCLAWFTSTSKRLYLANCILQRLSNQLLAMARKRAESSKR